MADQNQYKRMKINTGASSFVQLGNNTYVSQEKTDPTVTDLIRELFLTDASEDLSKTQRINGDRTEGTCEWLLNREEYNEWLHGRAFRLLWLVGPAGSGKTVISCFLVEELQRFVADSPSSTFAYYVCDNKDVYRRTAMGILRGVLVQLLQTRPALFGCVKETYKIRQGSLTGDVSALWTMFARILKHWTGPTYILIDALDECETGSRSELLHLLSRLDKSTNLRVIITSRPEPFIMEPGHALIDIHLNSTEINGDLAKFIDDKVKSMSSKYPATFVDRVKNTVLERAGGTFLWASLMLDEIATATNTKRAGEKLRRMPRSLEESYERIINDIPDDDKDDAALVLQWVVASTRPMTVLELATAMVLSSSEPWNSKAAPRGEDVEEREDLYKSCRQILYHDPTDNTVNLIHQSAKDYLTTRPGSSPYSISREKAGMQIITTCWKYLCLEFQGERIRIMSRTKWNTLQPEELHPIMLKTYEFLRYAKEELFYHSERMANIERIATFVRYREHFDEIPDLRDYWLSDFVRHGDADCVKILCEKRADTSVNLVGHFWEASPLLHVAATRGHVDVCNVLIRNGVDIDSLNELGNSALFEAVQLGRTTTTACLLQNKAKLDRGPELFCWALIHEAEDLALLLLEFSVFSNIEDESPDAKQFWMDSADSGSKSAKLNSALLAAVQRGYHHVAEGLIKVGANPAARCHGHTPLAFAVEAGDVEVAKLLIHAGAGVGLVPSDVDQCYLGLAIKHGQIAMMHLLIKHGADMEATECWGKGQFSDEEVPLTALCIAGMEGNIGAAEVLLKAGAKLGVGALHRAAEHGHGDMVKYLLDKGDDPGGRDLFCGGTTALHLAARAGNDSTIDVLITRGANVEDRDDQGWTSFHHAVMSMDPNLIMCLVRHGADVKAKTNKGQTALHIVAQSVPMATKPGVLEIQTTRILVNNGLDINDTDRHGRAALHYAAENSHIAMAKALLDHCAIIDMLDSTGATALHLAVGDCSPFKPTPSRPNHTLERLEMSELLIERGANSNLRDCKGRTVLFRAAATRTYFLCDLFLRQGLEPSEMCGEEMMHYPHVNELQQVVDGWRSPQSRGTDGNTGDTNYTNDEHEFRGPLRQNHFLDFIDAPNEVWSSAWWCPQMDSIGERYFLDRKLVRRQEALVMKMLFEMAAYILATLNPSGEWLVRVLRWGYDAVVQIIIPRKENYDTISREEISEAVITLSQQGDDEALGTVLEVCTGTLPEVAFDEAIWQAIRFGWQWCFRRLFDVRVETYTHHSRYFDRSRYCGLFEKLLHWGEGARHYITADSFEAQAFEHDQATIINMLLSLGDAIRADRENCFLLQAVEADQLLIVELLLAYGANINGTTAGGETAMQCALLKKSEKMVFFLLGAGADFDETETMAEILCYHLARNLAGVSPEVVVRLLNLLPERFKFSESDVATFRDWTVKNQYTCYSILDSLSRHAD